MRILVLHGWGNSTQPSCDFQMNEFKKLTSIVPASAAVSLVLPQGPIKIEEQEFRTFCKDVAKVPDEIIEYVATLPHYAWWLTRQSTPEEGEGKENASTTTTTTTKRCEGLTEISLPYLHAFLKDDIAKNGPIDFIAGFSQGGCLAMLFLLLELNNNNNKEPLLLPNLKGLLVVGSEDIRSDEYQDFLDKESTRKLPASLPVLFLSGTEDFVVPAETTTRAMHRHCEAAAVEAGTACVRTFPGGHHFPRDKETLQFVGEWLKKNNQEE
eukprot:PhM_4_TR5601/c0_g1_i1/m.58752